MAIGVNRKENLTGQILVTKKSIHNTQTNTQKSGSHLLQNTEA